MRTRILTLMLVGILVALMLPGTATAKDKGKAVCKKGGWMELVTADGQPFADQGECVAYAAEGGTPAPPPPSEILLAVAYTDMNIADGGYNPSVDVLIAKWVDDGDLGPGAGDRVIMNQYPKGFDFSTAGFGSFTVTEHIVTDTFGDGGFEQCSVIIGNDPLGSQKSVTWFSSDFENAEQFVDSLSGLFSEHSVVSDSTGAAPIFTALDTDLIDIKPGSLSQPADTINTERLNNYNDDPFLDIELNCAPTP